MVAFIVLCIFCFTWWQHERGVTVKTILNSSEPWSAPVTDMKQLKAIITIKKHIIGTAPDTRNGAPWWSPSPTVLGVSRALFIKLHNCISLAFCKTFNGNYKRNVDYSMFCYSFQIWIYDWRSNKQGIGWCLSHRLKLGYFSVHHPWSDWNNYMCMFVFTSKALAKGTGK